MTCDKGMFRAAVALRDRYIAQRRISLGHVDDQFRTNIVPRLEAAGMELAVLHKAVNRRFDRAAERVRRRAILALEDLVRLIEINDRAVRETLVTVPSPRELHEELLAARNEFGEIEFDGSASRCTVRTEPIRLEGINLGPFAVHLCLGQFDLAQPERCFEIEALEPHPSAADEEVTHPHVNGERLCCGDAWNPLRAALAGGRVSEAFVLIRSVLEQYNEDSPFVRLDEWEGVRCVDCDYMAVSDEHYSCQACGNDLCSECIRECSACKTFMCRECLSVIEASDAWVCATCSDQCRTCKSLAMKSELNDGQCQSCIDRLEQDEMTKELNDDQTDRNPERETANAKEQTQEESISTGHAADAHFQRTGVAEVAILVPSR